MSIRKENDRKTNDGVRFLRGLPVDLVQGQGDAYEERPIQKHPDRVETMPAPFVLRK